MYIFCCIGCACILYGYKHHIHHVHISMSLYVLTLTGIYWHSVTVSLPVCAVSICEVTCIWSKHEISQVTYMYTQNLFLSITSIANSAIFACKLFLTSWSDWHFEGRLLRTNSQDHKCTFLHLIVHVVMVLKFFISYFPSKTMYR